MHKPIDKTNVAYTEAYTAHCARLDYLYELEPVETNRIPFGENVYTAIQKIYEQEHINSQGHTSSLRVQLIEIYDSQNQPVYSYKVAHDHFLFKPIKHKNNKLYLLFNIDLYGYSILDLAGKKAVHYIPAESFNGGETFIWCDSLYAESNNLLAIDGCYWACPYGCEFYDFTNPDELPLPMYCDSLELSESYLPGAIDDIVPLSMTTTGECIVEYQKKETDDDYKLAQATLDIVTLFKERIV